MKKLNIGQDFGTELTNRDKLQRDGKCSGLEFRQKYLQDIDTENSWQSDEPYIELDFSLVKKLGPSWANEVFAYFAKYATPKKILTKVKIINISRVKESTINVELEKGYAKK
ncbi:MAG: STAS-like domain-containing protein [Oligoflexia bacterium]|nr:STAS-like domain-containing protein [Oligoflexia bacterium]